MSKEAFMRDLHPSEPSFVSGAGGSCSCSCPTRQKNNNGYGNGPESGPPPGNSGAHNPQLLGPNRGPRGPR
jgi:hypothetical protein